MSTITIPKISVTSKNNLQNKLIVLGVFLLLLFALKLFTRGLNQLLHLGHLYMIAGAAFGLGIGFVDKLLYTYITRPNDVFSKQVKNLISQKRFGEVIKVIAEDRDETRQLATNNILFLFVWIVLALFLITSSLSSFGRGLILGIGLVISLDLINDLERPKYLISRLFWPLARPVTEKEMKITVYFFLGSFVFLSLLTV